MKHENGRENLYYLLLLFSWNRYKASEKEIAILNVQSKSNQEFKTICQIVYQLGLTNAKVDCLSADLIAGSYAFHPITNLIAFEGDFDLKAFNTKAKELSWNLNDEFDAVEIFWEFE